jgi:biopolymer transport protein ExbB/TolQ
LTIRIVKVGDVNVGAAQLDNEWKDTRRSRVKSERDSLRELRRLDKKWNTQEERERLRQVRSLATIATTP